MTPRVRTCLCGGASLPDVDARFESCLPGGPLETIDIPEVDDQEPNASTNDFGFFNAPDVDDDEGPDWGSE